VRNAFTFGIAALLTGLGLYVAMALVALNVYDETPRPGWLNALFLFATALVVVGLRVMVNGAVRAYRERA
jgi:hypothetical protein